MYGYPDYQTGMYGAVPQMQARLNQLEGYQAQQLQVAVVLRLRPDVA